MEEILSLLGAKNPFDKNGDLTAEGTEAYETLIKILNMLHKIGAIAEKPDQVEKHFNEIMRLGF